MKSLAGFTLIELLVSMTLLGLLFVLLLGGLHFGARAWERSTINNDAGQTVRSVQDLLRLEIERACPRLAAATADRPVRPMEFTGTASTLQFWGPLPGAAGGAPCQKLLLQVRPDGALRKLVLRIGVNGPASDVLRRIRSASFSYLPQAGPWLNAWSGQPELPALVQLQVTFAAGDTRSWSVFFVSPRISAEADCTYDPYTKACRGS